MVNKRYDVRQIYCNIDLTLTFNKVNSRTDIEKLIKLFGNKGNIYFVCKMNQKHSFSVNLAISSLCLTKQNSSGAIFLVFAAPGFSKLNLNILTELVEYTNFFDDTLQLFFMHFNNKSYYLVHNILRRFDG